MSFGSLSAPAVRAINEGVHGGQSLHNTGEGGIAPHHDHGGGLVWQLGTGYFGAREPDGGFSMSMFLETLAAHDVGRSRSSSARVRSPVAAACSRPRRSRRRSRGSAASRSAGRAQPGGDTPRSRTPTACSTSSRCWRRRAGCRWGSSPLSANSSSWEELTRLMAADGSRCRLHHGRRRRGRDRGSAPGVQRSRGAAVQDGVESGLHRLRPQRHAREGRVHRRRQARISGDRAPRRWRWVAT